MKKFQYPETRTVDQIDDYHGIKVSDPYRWLEDTDSPQTRDWIESQNKLTFEYLDSIPERDAIKGRLTELWDYPKAKAPVKRGDYYFQLRNSGLQNQDVLFVMNGYNQGGRVLLDPNTLSEDGTVALSNWSVSPNGKLLAYAVSASGSDWLAWRVREVDTGLDLADVIDWSKFSDAAWMGDSSGFYYSRYDAPEPGTDFLATNYYQKLYFHRIGEPQDLDRLVYQRIDQKEWGFAGQVSDDGHYLIITVWQGTDVRNRVFYLELEGGEDVIELIPDLEAAYNFVGNDESIFYFYTDYHAPLGKFIAIDIQSSGKDHWVDIITEGTDTLEAVKMVNNEFIVIYLHHAHHLVKRFERGGQLIAEIPLPTLGSIPTLADERDLAGERDHDEMFFSFWSFLYPATVFRYDFTLGVCEQIFTPKLDIDTSRFTTRQVFVPSKDGTMVPLFLTHKQELVLDGQNPTLLYGYGGFNIALVPTFSVANLVWIERGGVLAWANLRGGSEYGESWHQAGMLDNKQNVFDDFISCGEYLIEGKITSTPKLAIMGRSNGGLLVGAAMTQRPDLFGVAIPVVGVMDMLRFHHFTIGWAWVSDYGCAEKPDEFTTLYAYSPVHNLKAGTHYPATLITTGDHDDRVVPGHSFKFAAALQATHSGDTPTLIRIQTKAGHGAGKPTALLIEETADILAFMAHQMDDQGRI